MDSSSRGKIARDTWKRLGLCARCGNNPAAPDRVKCLRCLEVTKQAISSKQKELVALGRCGACGAFRGRYRFYCDPCQATHSAGAAEGARRRTAARRETERRLGPEDPEDSDLHSS